MKRAFDLLLSSVGLVALAPLLALIGVLVFSFDGFPVLFRQKRIGYAGKPFLMYKFRTMVQNAESLGKPLTVGDDPRITRLGRWLRQTKLDELPQLFNVLMGEMSLVGPRPEVERYVARYNRDQRRVLDLIPGITDPASIRYQNEGDLLRKLDNPEQAYIEEILPEKIRINLDYASKASVLRDCRIIVQTLAALCRGKAAFVVAGTLTLTVC